MFMLRVLDWIAVVGKSELFLHLKSHQMMLI